MHRRPPGRCNKFELFAPPIVRIIIDGRPNQTWPGIALEGGSNEISRHQLALHWISTPALSTTNHGIVSVAFQYTALAQYTTLSTFTLFTMQCSETCFDLWLMTKQRAALFCAGGFFHSPINSLYKSELDKKEEQNEVWNQSEYLNICKVCNLGEKMTLKFWWKAKSDNDKKIQRESNGNWPVEAATAALSSRLLLWSHLARRRHGLGMNSQTGNCQCFAYLCNTISRFNYCVTLGLRTIVKHHGPLFLKSGTFATLLFPVL